MVYHAFKTLRIFSHPAISPICNCISIQRDLSQFNPCAIFCTPLRLDPGSPMYEDPAHYNIEKHYQSFTDYYIKCKKRAENSPYDALGYHTEFLDETAIFTLQQKWEALLRNHPVMAADLLHFV